MTGNAGEADAGLATPLEVYQGLAADGYQVSYRRVPLSRERTPEAADLDVLHQQLMTQPVGMCLIKLTTVWALLLLLALPWLMLLARLVKGCPDCQCWQYVVRSNPAAQPSDES